MVFFNKGFPCNETVRMSKLQWNFFIRGKLLDYSKIFGFDFLTVIKIVQLQLLPDIYSYAAHYAGLRKYTMCMRNARNRAFYLYYH